MPSFVLQESVCLKSYTTLKVGGEARYLAEVSQEEQLLDLLLWAAERKIPWLVLGRGSNLLISEEGFEGLVIVNRLMGERWSLEENSFLEENSLRKRAGAEQALLWAGAGENMAALAARSAKRGWAGIEFASGIPGSVGGVVAMNAGAYGESICQSLVEVRVCSCLGFRSLPVAQLDMTYRRSRFFDLPEVVVAACFSLVKDPTVKKRLYDMQVRRLSSQPWKEATAGCFFKNPESVPTKGLWSGKKCSAGFLIESAGLKGLLCKGAQVSSIHANFLLNEKSARAEDFVELCSLIREKIFQIHGLHLEGEVRFLKNRKGPLEYV